MAEEVKKRDRGYRAALTGIRGILRLLVFICLVVVLIYLGRRAYALGREAFNETPVDIGEGRTVVVTITDDMSTYDIGRMLRAEGLLTESELAFCLQELISEYHNQIKPGTYSLKTSMTTQEMFPILAQADKEDESGDSDFIAPGMQASDTAETEAAPAEEGAAPAESGDKETAAEEAPAAEGETAGETEPAQETQEEANGE